jgi:hypothetical protein
MIAPSATAAGCNRSARRERERERERESIEKDDQRRDSRYDTCYICCSHKHIYKSRTAQFSLDLLEATRKTRPMWRPRHCHKAIVVDGLTLLTASSAKQPPPLTITPSFSLYISTPSHLSSHDAHRFIGQATFDERCCCRKPFKWCRR